MRSDESQLLMDLYRPGDAPWQQFLARLSGHVQAGFAALILAPDDAGMDAQLRIYCNKSPPFDPISAARLRYQRVYAADELQGADFAPFARILRLRIEGGGDVWLYLGRDSVDFPASTGALMSSLGPHISVASAAYLRARRKDIQSEYTERLAVTLGAGWMTLSAQGIILSASPFALQLLGKTEPVFGQIGGRLALDSAGAKRLAEILAGTAGHVIKLPFGEMAILPRYDPQGIVTAYLRVQKDTRPAPTRALAELAQITPSEARFALKLGDGLTIVQAAEELGLTVETARNYSKKIYAKMALRGQTDLIRMLENSAIMLL